MIKIIIGSISMIILLFVLVESIKLYIEICKDEKIWHPKNEK